MIIPIKTISTFDLKIPNSDIKIKISFSGTEEDKKNLIKLYKINGFIKKNGKINTKSFISNLLIKSFEKRIKKSFEKYLEEDNEYFKDLKNIGKEYQIEEHKSLANLLISSDTRFINFKRKLFRDITDSFGDLGLEKLTSIITYLIEKEVNKGEKKDEN